MVGKVGKDRIRGGEGVGEEGERGVGGGGGLWQRLREGEGSSLYCFRNFSRPVITAIWKGRKIIPVKPMDANILFFSGTNGWLVTSFQQNNGCLVSSFQQNQ